MEKFKELRQNLCAASTNFARLEKQIEFFESSLNSDFVLSVCDNYLISSAYYPAILISSEQIAAIVEAGDVKGVTKIGIYHLVHAELFGYQVTCSLDEYEYENFIVVCKNES